jgi:cytochrome c oxidase subunit I+III
VRETIVTSPIEAAPQYLQRLPGPGWTPFLAAVFTAAFFMLLTVKMIGASLVCGVLAIACILVWVWGSDPEPVGDVDIGGGRRLPAYASGPVSHAWWAVVILMLVAGSLYLSFVFSYLYLWTVAPQAWPYGDRSSLPNTAAAYAGAGLLALSAASIWAAGRVLERSRAGFAALVLLTLLALPAALALEVASHWQSGLRPDASGYGALVYLASALQLQVVAAVAVIGCYTLVRLAAGRLRAARRVTFDTLALLAYYAAGQGTLGLILIHGFPRAVS